MEKSRVYQKQDNQIGHLSRAKIGSKPFPWNYKLGYVLLGPKMSHIVYGTTVSKIYKMDLKNVVILHIYGAKQYFYYFLITKTLNMRSLK